MQGGDHDLDSNTKLVWQILENFRGPIKSPLVVHASAMLETAVSSRMMTRFLDDLTSSVKHGSRWVLGSGGNP